MIGSLPPGVPTVPCPGCREFIHYAAQLCPLCHADVRNGGFSPEVLAEMRARVDTLIAHAGDPADPAASPSTLRVRTVVFWMLAGLSFLPVLLDKELWPIPMLGAFVFLLPAIFLGISDLFFPSPRKRKTPEAAVRCYYKGIRQRRWSVCWAALSAAGRGRRVTIPAVPEMKVISDDVELTDAKAIKEYWKPLVFASRSPVGMGRRIMRVNVDKGQLVAPHVARVRVEMVVEYIPNWIFILAPFWLVAVILYAVLRAERHITFEAFAVEHKSQWSVLTGEAWPPMDQRLLTIYADEWRQQGPAGRAPEVRAQA